MFRADYVLEVIVTDDLPRVRSRHKEPAVTIDNFVSAIEEHLNITIVRERIDTLPTSGLTIVATGPLTAASLADSIGIATGKDALAFFDAIAPKKPTPVNCPGDVARMVFCRE